MPFDPTALQRDRRLADRPTKMRRHQPERRSQARRRVDLPNGIEIRVFDHNGATRAIMSKLVDASPGGVGVETFTRLQTGTTVLVQANLQATGLALAIGGEARIAHSREISPGSFLVGLELTHVRYARASYGSGSARLSRDSLRAG